MNNYKTILLLAGALVTGCVFNATAQKRAERTSSAKAVYGGVITKTNYKTKKFKVFKNYTHTKPAVGSSGEGLFVRKKYNKIYDEKHSHGISPKEKSRRSGRTHINTITYG